MSPDSLWVSDPASRAGSCCTPPDNNCVQFSLTLAEDAVGILFSIPDGCGASPSGSLFYQVDCGPLTSVGSPLCLDGPGPFTITFCKPGHNENCYSIQSIAAPNASDNITITDACLDSLGVTGLDEPTITWTSIFPGEIGDYDYLLDCVAGCDTVVVEAVPGGFYPELIKYQMCGTSIGGCSGTPFCDTVSVSIVPLLSVSIEPEEPTICYGGVGIDLSAIPFGGAEPYTYTWNTGAVTADLYVTEPRSYSVMISDGTGCAIAYDTVEVTEYLEPITANAGEDITMCAVPAPTVSLGGIVTGSTTGEWSGGAGTFSPDITALDALYTPTLDELAAGFVELILTTTDNGMCPGDSDTLMIFFPVFTTEIESVVNNVNCFANATGAIDVVLSGGALPVTFEWNTGDISEDLIGILAGSYDVLLTDANGCTETLDFIVTEPPLLVESATLTNIACFGGVDGSVDLLVEGGTPEYDVVWETGELTEDLTGVAAGVYNFTVTDAN